jgi:dolichol-phosphate hexosyltransferase
MTDNRLTARSARTRSLGPWTYSMYRDRRITVVIPCLNEERGIVEVLRRMPSFVDEVIVVDNDSTDRTAELALSHGARVIHEKIRGYGRAYKTGLLHSKGDIIVTLDGDHSYPPDAISYLLEVFLRSEVRFLSASRFPLKNKAAMSFKHRLGNKLLSVAMSFLYFRWVQDSQSGMWVFEREILNEMDLVSDGMAFSEEIKIEAILKRRVGFKEIYIDYSNRMGEIKLQPYRDGLRNLSFLVRKRFGWTARHPRSASLADNSENRA